MRSETDDAAAGGGKEKRSQGKKSQEDDSEPTFGPHLSQNEGDQRDGNDQLRKASKVIAVHVRTKGDAPVMHLAKPIEFAVEGQMLKDAKNRHEKTKRHNEPNEETPVVGGAKRLSGEKKKQSQSGQELKLGPGLVRRSGAAKEKLRHGNEDKREYGR